MQVTSTLLNQTESGSIWTRSQRGRFIKLIYCKITLQTQVDENFLQHLWNLTDGNVRAVVHALREAAHSSSTYLLQLSYRKGQMGETQSESLFYNDKRKMSSD